MQVAAGIPQLLVCGLLFFLSYISIQLVMCRQLLLTAFASFLPPPGILCEYPVLYLVFPAYVNSCIEQYTSKPPYSLLIEA